jgi:hypothetical protein
MGIDLNRAKNYTRQAVEQANGGLGLYQSEASMHGPALQSPYVDNGDGSWTFTFMGGKPGWTNATIESIVSVMQSTGTVTIDYNGAVRSSLNSYPIPSNPAITARPEQPVYFWPTSPNAVILQQGYWQTSLELLRLVNSSTNTNALAVDFNVLSQPGTTYANAVYQIYGMINNNWVNLYTSTGARLLSMSSQRLPVEVIDVKNLRLPNNVNLEDLDLKTVVQLRYDGAEGRDRTVSFERILPVSQVIAYQSITDFERAFYGNVRNSEQNANR